MLFNLFFNAQNVLLKYPMVVQARLKGNQSFCQRNVMKKFAEFSGKYLFQSLVFNEVSVFRHTVIRNKMVRKLYKTLLFHRNFLKINLSQSAGAVVWRCFVKKVFLKILQNSQKNKTPVPESLFY